MSSFDQTRRPGGGDEAFAPFVPATPARGKVVGASVFPDLHAPPVGGDGGTGADPGEAAREAAYAAGFAEGKAAAERAIAGGASAFASAVEEVGRFRRSLLDRYQRELLELALGVARKVVQRELAEHPEHWLAMIREAAQRALDRETIRIRVGTVLHHYLVEQLPRLRAILEDVKELELVEDLALSETGCIIESRYGDLDLGIDGQMSAIRGALAGTA
jgi:flagellar assembly protein FliH